MKIDRSSLVSELATFARGGNGVIIGQPGVGKSYSLAELREKLKKDGVHHLILPVEQLGQATEADIRAILRREGDFVDLLRTAIAGSARPAILIFDGFDAARGENERAGILRLIGRAVNELSGEWNILVSVRTFDAKKSQRLLELFPDKKSEAGGACRQFLVPPLQRQELEQAFAQIPGLSELDAGGTLEFQALLTVPFNLWLIERSLRAGAKTNEFSQVTSEVQLLEMYWKYRVRRATNAEDRELILAKTTRAMVENHTLTIRREDAYLPEANAAWKGLLSDEVLCEIPEREAYVGFSHNILFDFAVSVHLLEASPAKFAEFVAEEPARPLFLRPSLLYHFTRLWHFERVNFWRNFWAVIQHEAIHLRQIIRLVLPTVVVNEAQTLEDLGPLLERLTKNQPGAAEAVSFLLQALRFLRSPKHHLWAKFIQSVGPYLDYKFAWDAGLIAIAIVESKEAVTNEIAAACGEFARQLLHWAWRGRSTPDRRQWFERLAGSIAIPLVAKTYATGGRVARRLFEDVLHVVGEPGFPIDCIYHLVNEIDWIMPHDPELVGEIYEKVFGYVESSDAQTHMGGHVLPFISNRRQDYGMCRFILIEKFSRFLSTSPLPALRAGIRSVQAFVLQEHVFGYLPEGKTIHDKTTQFRFRDWSSSYIEDNSFIWDQSSYPDQELKIADAVFDWLRDAVRSGRTREIDVFLDSFRAEAKIAFLWSRLLSVGAEQPAALGPLLWELAAAKPLLGKADIVYSLGTFLENSIQFLETEQRRAIERSILQLPQGLSAEQKRTIEQYQARLLARIPSALLVTPDAADLRQSLEQDSNLPENRPLFTLSPSWAPYTEEMFLREQGAEPDSPANRKIRDLYLPLVKWNEKGKEEAPIDSLLPIARALREALRESDGADASILRIGWNHLASFASAAMGQTQQADTERFRTLRELVLAAAEQPEPLPDSEHDLKWSSPSWTPAPRNEAAQVLPWMIHLEADERALSAVKKLATDPVPSVRFLLFSELWRILECSPELMWALFDKVAENEVNGVVLQGVTISLWHLIRPAKDSSLALIRKLLGRMDEESEGEAGSKSSLISMVVDYAVWEENPWAKDMIARWRSNPLSYFGSIAVSGQRLISYIAPQHFGRCLEVARDLLTLHLDAIAKALANLQRANAETAPQQLQKRWKSLYGIVDETVTRIYFAADVNPALRERKEHPLSDDARQRFFHEALPILERVLDFGKQQETGVLLAPTAHRFMELLNGVLGYDPALTVRMAAEVVRCSKRFGYNLDSMATAETVRLVESILADYRSEMQDDQSIKHLLEILDAFAEVGWPEALKLVWRLDEIYR
jgi:NACHT domain